MAPRKPLPEKPFSDDFNATIDQPKHDKQKQRGYMGLSQIGLVHECHRKAWLTMHGKTGKPFPGRILRLFRSGDNIETNIQNDLLEAGYDFHSDQKGVKATQGDIAFYGHIDGQISVVEEIEVTEGQFLLLPVGEYLLECKSCNEKGFNQLLRLNSYEEWKPMYKAQIHVYAYLLQLKEIIVCVENKNTSERYWEAIEADYKFALDTLQLAFKIYGERKPFGICKSREQFTYKWCDFQNECL